MCRKPLQTIYNCTKDLVKSELTGIRGCCDLAQNFIASCRNAVKFVADGTLLRRPHTLLKNFTEGSEEPDDYEYKYVHSQSQKIQGNSKALTAKQSGR